VKPPRSPLLDAPLRDVVSRTVRQPRGGTPYYSEYLACGHGIDEDPSDPYDARLRRRAKRRRCERCLEKR